MYYTLLSNISSFQAEGSVFFSKKSVQYKFDYTMIEFHETCVFSTGTHYAIRSTFSKPR